MLKTLFYLFLLIFYMVILNVFRGELSLEKFGVSPASNAFYSYFLFIIPVAILSGLSVQSYNSRNEKNAEKLRKGYENQFFPLWRGEFPLTKAFWGYYLPSASIFAFCGWGITKKLNVLIVNDVWMILLGAFALLAYQIITIVGAWRSSNRYQGPRKWVNLSRCAIVGASILMASCFFLFMCV